MYTAEWITEYMYIRYRYFFPVRVLKVLLRTDYKVGEEEIKMLSDVFVPLSSRIEKPILALVSQSNSVRVVGLSFYISTTFVCVLVIMQKENVLDCLLPRGMFLFVLKIFYMIIIIPSVNVLTKNWLWWEIKEPFCKDKKPEVNECELNWCSFDGYSQTAYG